MRAWTTKVVLLGLLLAGGALAPRVQAQDVDAKRGAVTVLLGDRTVRVPIPPGHMRLEDASPSAMAEVRAQSDHGVENVHAFIHREDEAAIAAGRDAARPFMIVQRIVDQPSGDVDAEVWAGMAPGVIAEVVGPEHADEDLRRGKGHAFEGMTRPQLYAHDGDSLRFLSLLDDGQYLASGMVRVDGRLLMLFGASSDAALARGALDDLIARTLAANPRR